MSSGLFFTKRSFPSTLWGRRPRRRGQVPWQELTTAPPLSTEPLPFHTPTAKTIPCAPAVANNRLTGRSHVCHTRHKPRPWSGPSHPESVPCRLQPGSPCSMDKPYPQLWGMSGPHQATYWYVIHCELSSGASTV